MENSDDFGERPAGERIEDALAFALKAHGGQKRKGSGEPFITHPAEVLSILNNMGAVTADPNLAIAGILHDAVEDTDTTIEMIEERFGSDVSALVAAHTEDKNLSWYERKQRLFDELGTADLRVKKLILADTLANERSMLRDYKRMGGELWKRFNAPKEKQAWYYGSVIEALGELGEIEETASLYRELADKYGEIFADLT